MKKIGLLYWPKGGNVEKTAQKIGSHFSPEHIIKLDILSVTPEIISEFDYLIIGGSTVGADNWQDASGTNYWNEFFKMLDKVDLKNKLVALFGLGDQVLYPNHFVDGLANLYHEFSNRGANIIGYWPLEGYEFYDSEAVQGNNFVGLVIDEDQQPELTNDRILKWIGIIKKDIIL